MKSFVTQIIPSNLRKITFDKRKHIILTKKKKKQFFHAINPDEVRKHL